MPVRRFRPIKIRAAIGASNLSRGYGLNRDLARQFGLLVKNMEMFAEHMRLQTPEIMKDALRPTFDKSQVYCPKKTGRLRASGYLETRRSGSKIEVEIGYGRSGNPDYAVLVHEVPNHHQAPTRWKFLQQALQEDEGAIQSRIIDGMREASGT